VAWWEVKSASNKEMHAWRERENPMLHQMGGERAGAGHPPRSGSCSEGEEEREITLPSLSSLRITLPLLRDVVCRQVGLRSVNANRNTPGQGLGRQSTCLDGSLLCKKLLTMMKGVTTLYASMGKWD
jgi:hypothetical protein